MRLRIVLALAAALAAAGDPPPEKEKGPLDPAIAKVRERKVVARKGTAEEALAVYLKALDLHRRGEQVAALAAWLEFEAHEGAHELPARYRATAARRLHALLDEVAKAYDAACALYREDRAAGREALQAFAERHASLPQGAAARTLLDSDALHAAIARARALDKEGKRPEAAALLEKALKDLPRALLRFEAKTLLKELGGPDLLEAKEKFEGCATEEEPAPKEEEEEATVTVVPDPK